MYKTFFIKPYDVIRFGAGTPAQAELEHILRTNLLPSPYTLRGALWSLLIDKGALSFKKFRKIVAGEVNDSEKYEKLLRMKIVHYGVYLEEYESFAIPVPLDVSECKDDEKGMAFVYDNLALTGESSKFVFKPLKGTGISVTKFKDCKIKPVNGYFLLKSFTEYLKGEKTEFVVGENKPQVDVIGTGKLFEIEKRVQTAISEKGIADEGRLFATEFVSPKDGIRYFAEMDIDDSMLAEKDKGTILMGGDMRTSEYQIKALSLHEALEKHREDIKERVKKTGFLKIILLSPGVFENGYILDYNSNRLELKSLAVGSYAVISGWSMGEWGSRTSLRAVPAGSYYTFRVKDMNELDSIFEEYYLKPHSMDDEFNNLGFGLTVIGVSNENKGGA